MLRYSAGYVSGNHNFVIQNLSQNKLTNKYTAAISIIKNILQRGCPTEMSVFLKEQLPGAANIQEAGEINLISQEVPNWVDTIKGDEINGYYPAKEFFYSILPHHLGKYKYVQALILPEVKITDIAGEQGKRFIHEQVDFYLPQAKLVIEIDGSQHAQQINQDKKRDDYLESVGIQTVRIPTLAIQTNNHILHEKLKQIIARCQQFDENLQRFEKSYYFFTVTDAVRATAVIRWQLTILSMLENGALSLEEPEWIFQIKDHEKTHVLELAIEDLSLWLQHICKLQKLPYTKPSIRVHYVNSFQGPGIQVDFSLCQRWTDEYENRVDIIVVRSDYFNDRDYFTMSTSDPINYNLIQDGEDSDIPSLHFFLKNLFGFDDFNSGQLPIILNSLSGRDTIGLLPTGGGKSLCYQFVAMLQPCISFVVVPIKSLMYDQVDNLKRKYFTRTNYINSDLDADEKESIQKDFARGKYWFVIISPERFQIREFRQYLSQLNREKTMALAVIDEVHCLSEWGHDFRTSYLHLVRTIQVHCPTARFLGLTATASKNVLKDISVEMDIGMDDVKTLLEYTRPELTFVVFRLQSNNREDLRSHTFKLLREMKNNKNVFEVDGVKTKSGLIFTRNVNGDRGCYRLANEISQVMETNTKYYSGEKPRNETYSEEEFNVYKQQVQDEFKNNKFPLLVATKAFGMGIDKANVRYTIHYGIPSSLESLYQEAGRAGRDKQDAACYVLYDKDPLAEQDFQKLFELNTTVEEIKQIQARYNFHNSRDILGHFFLWMQGHRGVSYETGIMKRVFDQYAKPDITKIINCKQVGLSFNELQKAVYRLSLIGIVDDWLVTGWGQNGELEVTFASYNDQTAYEALLTYIHKYDIEFSLTNDIPSGHRNKVYYNIFQNATLNYFERLMKILVQWSYDNIFYHRRQSLRTLDELCNELAEKSITREEFKQKIENYFCFTENTYVLDHIAQFPSEYKRWFELFVSEDGNLKSKQELKEIEAALVRFLESYRYNTGLNFVSGIVRLLTDRYNALDGRDRLISAFQQIVTYAPDVIEEIFQWAIQKGSLLTNENKNHLSEALCIAFGDRVIEIYEALQDEHSLSVILDHAEKKLIGIGERLYGRY